MTTTSSSGATSSGVRKDRNLDEVISREEDRYGGVKIGSAFFGWLCATGMAILLTALVVAAGAAVGLTSGTNLSDATDQATDNADTIGIAGGIALLVLLSVAYYCGGYVAGRMARFNGAKQGVAVWLWSVVIAAAIAILGAVAGSKYDVLGQTNVLPRIPVDEGDLTTGAIVALVLAVLVTLGGAIVGGIAGMHFHRKVDEAGVTP